MTTVEREMELRPLNVALGVPATRMVVVEVWRDKGKICHWFWPVVAIESQIIRFCYDEDREGEQEVRRHAVYVGDGGQLTTQEDERFFGSKEVRRRAAACPWPPEEDEKQLAWIVDELAKGIPEK